MPAAGKAPLTKMHLAERLLDQFRQYGQLARPRAFACHARGAPGSVKSRLQMQQIKHLANRLTVWRQNTFSELLMKRVALPRGHLAESIRRSDQRSPLRSTAP